VATSGMSFPNLETCGIRLCYDNYIMNVSFNQTWYAPLFSSLLESRREGLIIVGAGALHLGLSLAGLPAWSCPIRAVTGIPCPGCGLTHAVFQLLQGDITASLQTHVFAPIFILAFMVLVFALFLPEKYRRALVSIIEDMETHNGLTSYLLLTLILYWCIRLMGIIPLPKNF
jgi:hypothetical protein